MTRPAAAERGEPSKSLPASAIALAVVVAALGYFVDIYDLVLFSILRVPSLHGLGLEAKEITDVGAMILNVQLAGMIVGGVAWGVLGDRRGRLTVLFGSIILYSVANLANAFVSTVPQYALLRFIAGFGLAGELGAGITLVSELMPRRTRGIGTTIVATVGLAGAVVAGFVGKRLLEWYPESGWRIAYAIGGGLGLVLLILRIGVLESGLFARSRASDVPHGDLRMLVWPPERLGRFVRVILVGMPIWFGGGVLFVFAPEIGHALGLAEAPTGGDTIFMAYSGVVIGDLVSGLLSQFARRRKAVLAIFLTLYGLAITAVLTLGGRSLSTFYGLMFVLGATTGYWVLFVTVASEQFGTNLRATVTTSAPNFVRGMAIPILLIWTGLQRFGVSTIPATLGLGLTCVAIGLFALFGLRETFDRDLDYAER